MKVPLSWLREYCDPHLDTDRIEERLTMTGTKVETVLRHGAPSDEHFVLGKVLSVQAHPDADRLRVCSVDVGAGEPVGIVCGAPNVAAGQAVAVALPGATMPGGAKIEQAKLRGVASSGMILAADELEIDSDHSGIMVLDVATLDAELAPGTPLAELLSVGTDVLELEITPNRPDCLGVYGVARELHAATGAPLAGEPWREDPGSAGGLDMASVAVQCPDLCPRFTARVFEEVKIGPSPLWLKARLSAAGQRPINNVVDITNYAMLLTGQPLHAFDLDRVEGARLTVRRAADGERVTTLDGHVRTLDSEMVVIDDARGPTSIAGIMGGERSEVHEQTTRVLMEVANWSGPNIHRTSWALGLRSEASGRFEKGLAAEQCLHAQAVASRLMVELCGARLQPGTIDLGAAPEQPRKITLRERRVAKLLGMPVARERQAQILRALDFQVRETDEGLEATVPAARREDVTREADLIEEIARINGLAELPASLPARRGAYGRLTRVQQLRRRASDALVGRGLYEIVGWTFAAPAVHDRLRLPRDDPRRRAPVLENPLSEEQSLLRTTLLGSLLDAAHHNAARGMTDLRLFELGRVFALADGSGETNPAGGAGSGDPAGGAGDGDPAGGASDGKPVAAIASSADVDTATERAPGDTGICEHVSLAVLLAGEVTPSTWRTGELAKADFFAAKGVLEALAEALGVQLECDAAPQPFLHPGRAADVSCAGERIGWVGELHPLVAREWDLEDIAVIELDLDRLLALAVAREHGYRDVISYPALRQDLAVVLPDDVPAGRATELVRAAGGELLDEVRVFDVYSGEQLGEQRRSLALALSFRAADRTLTDADVAPLRERIVVALEELGGELRA